MLTANQIYKANVKHTATPFHIWLAAEKKNYCDRKNVSAEDLAKDPDAFTKFINKRYSVGGAELWSNHVRRVMTSPEQNSEVTASQNTDNATPTMAEVQTEVIGGGNGDVIKEKATIGGTNKTSVTKPQIGALPFYKKKYLNMPFPLTAGLTLIAITGITLATVATIKHFKKS